MLYWKRNRAYWPVNSGVGETQERTERMSSSGSSKTAKMRCDEIEGLSIDLMREHVLRQVWGPGGPRDSESGRRFTPKLFASLENNVEVFPG
jgi:hypothetical protein